MKLSELKRVVKQIEDCDYAEEIIAKHFKGDIESCLVGALIQLKNKLLERLKLNGVNIDLEV